MTLEVYHLQLSQSERIIWLLEEMQVPYELKLFKRDPQTGLSPPELKSITPTGTAPYFRDTSTTPPVALFETMAIVDYILTVYGPTAPGTRMHRTPTDPDYIPYLSWLHFANGSLQPSIGRNMTLTLAGQADTPIGQRFNERLRAQIQLIDDRLGESRWLAGEECSAADCVTVFSLTTMRGFFPVDLGRLGMWRGI